MEIQIGKGVGDIQFGLVESQIIERLGKPDKVYELEWSKRLQYYGVQIEVSLEFEHQDRFGWVEVKNPNATLFGHQIFGASVETVLSMVPAEVSEIPEMTDYGSFESYYFCDNALELEFEFNRLRSINFGFKWLDDETPDWPTKG